jgi:hypothetical protein
MNMKKILITILFMIAALSVYGQNKFKYQVQALGGISIGNTADTVKIDSVILSGSFLKFYRGSSEVFAIDTTSLSDRIDLKLTAGLIDSLGTVTVDGQYPIYVGADTVAWYIPVSERQELNTVVPMLADTVLYFAPVIGVGNAGDTLGFTLNNVIWGAKWEGSHSLVITKVTGVVYGTTPDIDVALLYDANFRDGTPVEVFSSDLTITSTTTGDNATINASNDTIASGTWLWLRVDQATAKPTQCIINIYGYLE